KRTAEQAAAVQVAADAAACTAADAAIAAQAAEAEIAQSENSASAPADEESDLMMADPSADSNKQDVEIEIAESIDNPQNAALPKMPTPLALSQAAASAAPERKRASKEQTEAPGSTSTMDVGTGSHSTATTDDAMALDETPSLSDDDAERTGEANASESNGRAIWKAKPMGSIHKKAATHKTDPQTIAAMSLVAELQGKNKIRRTSPRTDVAQPAPGSTTGEHAPSEGAGGQTHLVPDAAPPRN
ncbi:hypothetical protein GGF42_006875, partial [Coemansia sp. RSA 2424]